MQKKKVSVKMNRKTAGSRPEDENKLARLKAMNLLADMDRTQFQLREKLKKAGFSDHSIEEAIAYVGSFGYLNDERFTENYIDARKQRKSRRELFAELSAKGIPSELIEDKMSVCYTEEDEQEAILHLLKKRRYRSDTADSAEKQKTAAYLARKGFSYREIQRVMEITEMDDE